MAGCNICMCPAEDHLCKWCGEIAQGHREINGSLVCSDDCADKLAEYHHECDLQENTAYEIEEMEIENIMAQALQDYEENRRPTTAEANTDFNNLWNKED